MLNRMLPLSCKIQEVDRRFAFPACQKSIGEKGKKKVGFVSGIFFLKMSFLNH